MLSIWILLKVFLQRKIKRHILSLNKRGLIGTRISSQKIYGHLLYDKHLRLDDYISFYVNIWGKFFVDVGIWKYDMALKEYSMTFSFYIHIRYSVTLSHIFPMCWYKIICMLTICIVFKKTKYVQSWNQIHMFMLNHKLVLWYKSELWAIK